MKKLNHIYAMLAAFTMTILALTTQAQVVTLEFAHGFAGDRRPMVITDSSGNIFLAGGYSGTIDVDPSPAVQNLTCGINDIGLFIAKYTSGFSLIWAISIQGAGCYMNGHDIAIDHAGNVVVTGAFEGTCDFDPSPAIFQKSSSYYDVFLAKYSDSGDFLWAVAYGCSGEADRGKGCVVDDQDNVFLVGYYQKTVDFNAGVPGFSYTAQGGCDVFLAKYSPGGSLFWVKSIGGSLSDYGEAIAYDPQGNIIITGDFRSQDADFDPSPNFHLLGVTNSIDVFIAKYDLNGNYIWAINIGTNAGADHYGIQVEQTGAVIVTGLFQGTADFDPSPSTTANLISAGGQDLFYAKYQSSGAFVFAHGIGTPSSSEKPFQLELDGVGNFYICGYFGGDPTDFDPIPSHLAFLNSNGGWDAFVSSYDPSGNYRWAFSVGGTGGDIAESMTFNNNGALFIAGTFKGTVDFDPGAGVASLNSSGVTNIFLCKYLPVPGAGLPLAYEVDGVEVYPNPTDQLLSIVIKERNSQNALLQIYSVTGDMVFSQPIRSTESIDISPLPAGSYWLRIQLEAGTVIRKLIVL